MRKERVIETGVPLLLPLAGGAVAALAAAAAGPALATLAVATTLAAVALIGSSAHRAHTEHLGGKLDEPARRRRRRQIALAVGAIACTALVAALAAPTPLTRMDRDELHAAMREDLRLYRATERGVDTVLGRLQAAGVPPSAERVLSAEQERILDDSWRALVDHLVVLESLRRYYDSYYLLDLSERRDEHALGFLLTFAADVAAYDASSEFVARILENDNARKFLDAPREDTPAGSFSRFREDLLAAADQLRIAAGKGYLEVIDTMVVGEPLASVGHELRVRIGRHLHSIEQRSPLEHTELTYRAELQRMKRAAVKLWYPVQKKAAELLGDTRVRRPGHYLIGRALREEIDEKLEPGDILLARKNWYLSNIGLPGFWPHAMIYLGDAAKLDAYFDDEQVRRWAQATSGESTFALMLEHRFPRAWHAYLAEDHGEKRRVIEAISEGVTFSTLRACAGDYFAAVRPRLGKIDKAAAIAFAFSQHEKPYDFDFDFATDHALVCTELVWRAFRSSPERSAGVDFTLVPVAGRMTLPANQIVDKYARELGTPGAELDFVVFVDAREQTGEAFVSTEEAFAETHQRTKWDIAQD